MAAVGVGAWIYRTFLYRLVNPPLEHTVQSARRLAGQVVEATLRPTGPVLQHAAGQFAFFSFAGVGTCEAHPFTISSPPGTDELRVAVKALGDDTAAMQTGLKVGAKVEVDGPFGHFTAVEAPEPRQVWIAGGIGITPFLSLAREPGPAKQITLFWSVRAREEACFLDELEALARDNPGFSFELWCSDERGHLSSEHVVAEDDLSHHAFLICGPTAMKNALIGQLEARGVRAAQIHDEEFSFR
jgi:predicted ferric reductase